jgi:hypothetical protein
MDPNALIPAELRQELLAKLADFAGAHYAETAVFEVVATHNGGLLTEVIVRAVAAPPGGDTAYAEDKVLDWETQYRRADCDALVEAFRNPPTK